MSHLAIISIYTIKKIKNTIILQFLSFLPHFPHSSQAHLHWWNDDKYFTLFISPHLTIFKPHYPLHNLPPFFFFFLNCRKFITEMCISSSEWIQSHNQYISMQKQRSKRSKVQVQGLITRSASLFMSWSDKSSHSCDT